MWPIHLVWHGKTAPGQTPHASHTNPKRCDNRRLSYSLQAILTYKPKQPAWSWWAVGTSEAGPCLWDDHTAMAARVAGG